MQPRLANVLLFIAAALPARPTLAADATAPAPERAGGLIMLDYQSLPVRGYPSIDLAGVHVLNRFNDWLYGGVGAHAPLVKGAYGGFMAFDATLHAQADVAGRLYADGGVSFGGGGGGNSVSQSRVISGSGAFTKVYGGLGWHFDDFSAGLNVSHLRFSQSVIKGTRLDFALEVPFSYAVTPYASAGHGGGARPVEAPADDSTLMFGLDNFIQVKPKGTYRNAINLADVQFNHFLTGNTYALVEGSVGYRGLPIYNQLLGGVGYRATLSRDVDVYGQVAVGSGGYDPQQFDTGPGLLVYPKVFGEYRVGDHVGLALSAGYLFAPRGTSRNLTLGAALNYHLASRGAGTGEAVHNGYRIDVFEQSELHPKIGDRTQGVIRLITTQVDDMLSRNVYVPIQASVATSRYLGYPGYGEALTGLGLQTTRTADGTFQGFAQLVAGINVHGVIAKPAIGLNVGLGDRLAIYAQVGKTTSVNMAHLYPARYRFEATHIGLGMTYRFSLPG